MTGWNTTKDIRHDTNQQWEKAVEENRQLWQTVHDKLQRLKEAQDAY